MLDVTNNNPYIWPLLVWSSQSQGKRACKPSAVMHWLSLEDSLFEERYYFKINAVRCEVGKVCDFEAALSRESAPPVRCPR